MDMPKSAFHKGKEIQPDEICSAYHAATFGHGIPDGDIRSNLILPGDVNLERAGKIIAQEVMQPLPAGRYQVYIWLVHAAVKLEYIERASISGETLISASTVMHPHFQCVVEKD